MYDNVVVFMSYDYHRAQIYYHQYVCHHRILSPGLIQSLADGYLHLHTYICIIVMEPMALNYDHGLWIMDVGIQNPVRSAFSRNGMPNNEKYLDTQNILFTSKL